MKPFKYILVILLVLAQEHLCYAQQEQSVETLPDVYLYAVPKDVHFPEKERRAYDISSWKKKRIKKPTRFEVIDYSNLNKAALYETYVVNIKGKQYFLRSTDVVDNTLLDNRNDALKRTFKRLLDSVQHYSAPVVSYNRLISLLDARIDSCQKAVEYYREKEDSIASAILYEKTKNDIKTDIEKYRIRREHYFNWVSTLPSAIQKDAKLLAITQNDISSGYFGCCDYHITFVNTSKKTIKYLTWSGRVKNAVGDYVSCEMRHTSSFSGKYTGPCKPYMDDYAVWEGVLFNGTAEEMVLTSIKIIYTDGTSATISKQSLDVLTHTPSETMFGKKTDFMDMGRLGSVYDEGYDFDTELHNKTFIYKDGVIRDIRKQRYQYDESLKKYTDVKRVFVEKKPNHSLLTTYLKHATVFSAIDDDKAVISAAQDYCDAIEKDDDITKRYKLFKENNFGFYL